MKPTTRRATGLDVAELQRQITAQIKGAQASVAAHRSETKTKFTRSVMSECIAAAAREFAREVQRAHRANAHTEQRSRSRISVRGRSRAARCGQGARRTKSGAARSGDPGLGDDPDPARRGILSATAERRAPQTTVSNLRHGASERTTSNGMGVGPASVRQFQGGGAA